ncbi:MAG: hypothetical protein HC803_08505 [Saprospiraceae bacterium]|nr:hypothetical protein [Saprospiraceae bacterium]
MDYCPDIGVWDSKPMKKVFSRIYRNSVMVGSETTDVLAALAKKHEVVIVIGINEIAKQPQGTIYNTILTFNEKANLRIIIEN